MRISDWSSDVCSSDLQYVVDGNGQRHGALYLAQRVHGAPPSLKLRRKELALTENSAYGLRGAHPTDRGIWLKSRLSAWASWAARLRGIWRRRSEEHTSELQSLMRISYAVFCLKKKNTNITTPLTCRTSTKLSRYS